MCSIECLVSMSFKIGDRLPRMIVGNGREPQLILLRVLKSPFSFVLLRFLTSSLRIKEKKKNKIVITIFYYFFPPVTAFLSFCSIIVFFCLMDYIFDIIHLSNLRSRKNYLACWLGMGNHQTSALVLS